MQSRLVWTRSLRRLIAWATVLIMVVLGSVALIVYNAYQEATSELVIERDRQVAYLSAARLQQELSQYADVLDSLARTPEIYRGRPSNQQAALENARFRLAVFDGGVVLLDNFGRVQAMQPVRSEMLGSDWSGHEFFGRLLTRREVVFSDAASTGADGTTAVVVGVPVLGERGEFVGALAGMFLLGEPRASSFYASIVRLRMSQRGTTYVIDGGGTILYDSSYSQVGRQFDSVGLPALVPGGGSNAVRVRNAGGNDVVVAYAPVPGTNWTLVTEDEWLALMGSAQRYTGILFALILAGVILPSAGIVLLVRHRDAELRNLEQRERDAQAAERIQQVLLPKYVPVLPGWNINIHYQPSHAYGGDFYDFMFMPDGRLMLTLVDITDRGVEAAVEMTTARSILRTAARRMLRACEAMQESNTFLCPEMRPEISVCCIYAILDPSSGHVELSNASRLTPYHCRHGQAEKLGEPGTPLGLTLDARYEQVETVMEQDDHLVLFSDGLIEARDAHGEMFGAERLLSILGRHANNDPNLADVVLEELRAFTGKGWVPEDDVTFVVLARKPRDSGY